MSAMRQLLGVAWIGKAILAEMVAEADRAFPLETGGVLLGYWTRPFEEVVVAGAIGPGPNASHAARRFCPDAAYQEDEIARRYQASGRLHTYLGEWHSHPDAGPRLSRLDRRTLMAIAAHPEARASTPIMAILVRGGSWIPHIWRFGPKRIGSMPIPGMMTRLALRPF